MEHSGSVVCFGDSITAGIPGRSYVEYLQKVSCENHGLGGDTLLGMTGRLKKYLEDDKPVSTLLLQIGTNDILHDLLKDRSYSWSYVVKSSILAKGAPARTPEEYRKGYERVLDLTEGIARRIVISIPCISEDPESGPNTIVVAYNEVLEELCRERSIPFVDIASSQRSVYQKVKHPNPRVLSDLSLQALIDSFTARSEKSVHRLSKRRGLSLTIDGVHLNTTGARLLAKLVDASLNNLAG